jgi:alkanesulfonate monooxygenase SsuD/methylene tetrahydromethanopterin reductase-like flavin-dependent oxidoreductase (luciferase family)
VDAATRLVSDELLDKLTVCGTPDECRARLQERRATGIDHPIVFPLLDNTDEVCRVFAPTT